MLTACTALYGTGNGGYDLHDESDNIIGTCDRPADPDDAWCSQFITNQDIIHTFTCEFSFKLSVFGRNTNGTRLH